MPSNPLTWGMGPFQTCLTTPFVHASESLISNESDNQIFSNGKLLTFGFKICPSNDIFNEGSFYDEFKENFHHLILNYQLIHERKGVLFSKSVESRGLESDGAEKLSILRTKNSLVITASSRFKVSPMHLLKSLTLNLSLEFSSARLANVKMHRVQSYQMDNDEKDIRNAIENPKYRPQRVAPRKGKIAMSFIEPLEISFRNKECGPESTLIHLTIANKHPNNDLLLFSVNLSMNTTVRDFDGDSSKIGIKGLKDSNNLSVSSLEGEGIEGRLSAKDSHNNSNEDGQSTTSTDEGNVEEYLRIIRADRFFHVTEVVPENIKPADSPVNKNIEKSEPGTRNPFQANLAYDDRNFPKFLKIEPGCSHRCSYRISAKDPSNLVVGNFLTPLGIHYIDVCSAKPPITDIYSSRVSGTSLLPATRCGDKMRSQSQLCSSSQVAWSLGTKYLNRSAFCKDVHVYNLDSAHVGFNAGPYSPEILGTHQGEDSFQQDFSDQILIAIDGPTTAIANVLFQVLVRTTNLSRSTKLFSLGIRDKGRGESSSGSVQYIVIEAETRLGEMRSGDTVETVINILPLQRGELVLDGFYLAEKEDEKEVHGCVHLMPIAAGLDPHIARTTRVFANSFPVNII